MTKQKIKVDAVILWVNGNEATYKAKILPYLDEQPNIKKNFDTRYSQINEIEFTVNSILKHASFINSIFLVTDNQTPEFLKEKSLNNKYVNVKIVDHTTLFKGLEDNLPTFNSRTLESVIHKIPGLSEHFIYLNDDFFIISPTTQNDFFTDSGFPILRGMWQPFEKRSYFKKKKTTNAGHKKAQVEAAKILGFKKLYRFKHTPHPLRKSNLSIFFDDNQEIFKENIKYKFRNSNQFLPIALANHLEIKQKTCQLKKDLQLMYFRSYKKPLIWYKYKLNNKVKGKLFLGLQSLDQAPLATLNFVLKWLEKRINS